MSYLEEKREYLIRTIASDEQILFANYPKIRYRAWYPKVEIQGGGNNHSYSIMLQDPIDDVSRKFYLTDDLREPTAELVTTDTFGNILELPDNIIRELDMTAKNISCSLSSYDLDLEDDKICSTVVSLIHMQRVAEAFFKDPLAVWNNPKYLTYEKLRYYMHCFFPTEAFPDKSNVGSNKVWIQVNTFEDTGSIPPVIYGFKRPLIYNFWYGNVVGLQYTIIADYLTRTGPEVLHLPLYMELFPDRFEAVLCRKLSHSEVRLIKQMYGIALVIIKTYRALMFEEPFRQYDPNAWL